MCTQATLVRKIIENHLEWLPIYLRFGVKQIPVFRKDKCRCPACREIKERLLRMIQG